MLSHSGIYQIRNTVNGAKRLKEWGVVERAFTTPVRDWSKR